MIIQHRKFPMMIPALIIVFLLFTPLLACAGTFYVCTDKDGNDLLTNTPSDKNTCKPVGTFEGMTREESDKYYEETEKIRTEEYERRLAKEEEAQRAAAESEREKRLRDLEGQTTSRYPVYYASGSYWSYPLYPGSRHKRSDRHRTPGHHVWQAPRNPPKHKSRDVRKNLPVRPQGAPEGRKSPPQAGGKAGMQRQPR
jgi:hypothetical protein